MKKFIVEDRQAYIYVKFTKHLDHGEITAAAREAKMLLRDNPLLNLLIDDSDIRYKDLSAANKLEAIEAITLVRHCPRTAAVIAADDDKLRYYADFVLAYGKMKNITVTDSIEEAITWVSESSELATD